MDNKRCSNCAKYPFCNKCEEATGCCENWMKREIGTIEEVKFNKNEETK